MSLFCVFAMVLRPRREHWFALKVTLSLQSEHDFTFTFPGDDLGRFGTILGCPWRRPGTHFASLGLSWEHPCSHFESLGGSEVVFFKHEQ